MWKGGEPLLGTRGRLEHPRSSEAHHEPVGLHSAARVGMVRRSRLQNRWLAASVISMERHMAESVYKVIELVGSSTESWEKAASAAVQRASESLRDLRVAEVSELDMVLKDGVIQSYRAKVKVSFKFEPGE